MTGTNALPSHLPTEPSDTRNQAHKENTAVALRTTGLSFTAPMALAGLLPPGARPFAALGLTSVIWPAAQHATSRGYNYVPAPGAGHALIEDVAKYGPFIPAFVTHTALMDPKTWTGRMAQSLQQHLSDMVGKSRFAKPLSGYPLVSIAMRAASQMGASYSGARLREQYAEKVRGAGIEKSGQEGKFDLDKFVESVKNHADMAPVTFLFLLVAGAYHPAGRAAIAKAFNIDLTQKLAGAKVEAAQTSALIGSVIAANAFRRHSEAEVKPE